MVITIDGPAGSGKSSLSKEFAKKISFQSLDTGAMYRSVALLVKNSGLSVENETIQQQISSMDIQFRQTKVYLNDVDVSQEIRTSEIDILTAKISTNSFVRDIMKKLQRKVAENTNIVAEGRDMGSNVFPHAEIKFYLTALPEVRAKRRHLQLIKQGVFKDLDELIEEIEQRDKEDSERVLNPLCIPHNAFVIDTSNLTEKEVFQEMMVIYHKKRGNKSSILLN